MCKILTSTFGHLTAVLSQPAIREFREQIAAIPKFEFLSGDPRSYPTITVKDAFLNRPEALQQFKHTVEGFTSFIHKPN